VHIAQPDGKIVPFDTFNLFYRDGLADRLAALRTEIDHANAHVPPAFEEVLP
jgi:uncharacterized radical SAM superfamily Fe-S cluster-containing enzyme